MKNGIVLITILLVSFPCFCQIGTTDVAAPKQQEAIVVFDSTKNFLGTDNVFSYEGQLLFVLPVSKGLEKYGYRGFEPAGKKSNNGSLSKVDYEELAEKYFYVEKVSEYNDVLRKKYIFYLTEKDNSENRYWFYYDPQFKHSFPFFVVSHFNYLRNRYIGKKFIIAWNYLKSHDIITGDTVVVPNDAKMVWTATDISIVNDDYRKLSVIVKNGNTTSCVSVDSFEDALSQGDARRVFEKSEWDKLVSTYGFSTMKAVLSAEIKVGMPLKLLIMAWGKPDKINSSSSGDQYVYNGQYVYVRGGKVTAWN